GLPRSLGSCGQGYHSQATANIAGMPHFAAGCVCFHRGEEKLGSFDSGKDDLTPPCHGNF
ncbi:MAG: hypothetical protein ABL936_09425, partial [Aestuariivirga sp.]